MFNIQPSGVARYTFFTDTGDAVDFTNNQPADILVVQPGVELKLGRARQRHARPHAAEPGRRGRQAVRGQPDPASADLQLQRAMLFLGYSDNRLGNQDFSLEQTDRTFFLKVGYAWVM